MYSNCNKPKNCNGSCNCNSGCNNRQPDMEYFFDLLCQIVEFSAETDSDNNNIADGQVPGHFQQAIDLVNKAIAEQKLGIAARDQSVALAGQAFNWYHNNVNCQECNRIELELKKVLKDMNVLENEGLELMIAGAQKMMAARKIKTTDYLRLENQYFNCVGFNPNSCVNNCNCNCNCNHPY